MIYLLTTIVLTPGGGSTVHIYTQTIHRTEQNRTYIIIRIHNVTKKIHNLQNQTEAYKTYNHKYNNTKLNQKNAENVITETANLI